MLLLNDRFKVLSVQHLEIKKQRQVATFQITPLFDCPPPELVHELRWPAHRSLDSSTFLFGGLCEDASSRYFHVIIHFYSSIYWWYLDFL